MDSFIKLPIQERNLLFNEAAKRHGKMNLQILEKDFWVCWTLKRLFTLPKISSYLTFKGGTSLSKVYGLIDRFSEDIDLTINKEYLGINIDNYLQHTNSRKARQEFRKILDKACKEVILNQFLPSLKKQFSTMLRSLNIDESLIISENDPLTILFQYPTSIEKFDYIKPVVRLEFGARGDNFPATFYTITPYVSDILPEIFDNIDEVKIDVNVLEAERTFWEKVVILHELYHKDKAKPLKPTIARHYYDIVMLFKKGFADKALKKLEILEAVVKNAKVNCTDSNESQTYKSYDMLLQKNIKLAPQDANISDLKKDYINMQEHGMFFGDFLNFENLLKELKSLEEILNT